MRKLHRARGQRGFSLVETLAALLVFGIVTLGIVPLLMTSLKGSALSRSYTVGKNVTLEAMERIRGLPYFVAYTAQPRKVDVVDLYFPNLVGNAALKQSYASGTFTTVCDSSTAANPACPRTKLETIDSITFVARFVNPDGSSPPIRSDYAWNSSDNKDIPPSQLLDMSVTSTWRLAGRSRSFKLQGLVGDRKSGDLKLRGVGRIDYAVQVLASFVPSDPSFPKSELLVVGGSADARVEAKAVAIADQTARAALLRLTRTSTDTTALDLGTAEGAASSHHAPPDSVPLGTSAGPKTIVNSDVVPLLEVAGIDDTLTSDLEVKVANQLPLAKGRFSYQDGAGLLDLWVMNQADTSNTAALRLDPSQKVFSIRPNAGDGTTLKGDTRAETTAVGAPDRKVETTAKTSFKDSRLLPTAGVIADTKFGGAVVAVESFSAETTCTATKEATTSAFTSNWSGVLWHWEDTNPSDGLPGGEYKRVDLGGSPSGTTDPLAATKTRNPLVYDDPDANKDVYLFRQVDATGAVVRNGYLVDWKSKAVTGGGKSGDGSLVTAGIDTAIRIDTAPTNPALPESGLNVSIGKLSCEALDQR